MDIKDFIAVDIGNTTCEFAIFKNNKIISKAHVFSKPLINIEDIKNLGEVNQYFTGGLFVISSVTKENNLLLKNFLEEEYHAEVLIIDSLNYNLKLKTKTREKTSIGLDIVAKSEWAIHYKKNPCLIIDVGTATVVQYIDEEGYMNKVAITLGLTSIYKVLSSNTSALPLVEIKKTKEALGFDTVSAMQRGIYWGYIGTIDSLISKAIAEINFEKAQEFKFSQDGNFSTIDQERRKPQESKFPQDGKFSSIDQDEGKLQEPKLPQSGKLSSIDQREIKPQESNINLFITGGLSGLIVDDLQTNPTHNADIIFEGIKVILQNNMDKVQDNINKIKKD